MVRFGWACLLAMFLLTVSSLPAEEPVAVPEVAWGKIVPGAEGTGLFTLEIADWPADGKLKLPKPFANITRAYLADDSLLNPLTIENNLESKQIVLHLPIMKPGPHTLVQLETAASTTQYADGRIVLSASDAKISFDGNTWKKPPADEITQQGQHAVLLKNEKLAMAGWEYMATRPGMYEVEVTYASPGVPDAEIEVTMLGQAPRTISTPRRATNNLKDFRAETVGKFYIPAAGQVNFALMSRSKQSGFVPINLKAITLRPTCEGKMPEQAEDGTITCHARDVTIQGVKVQYEPKPEKNTVGYWVNEKDWVYWDFTANKAGKYQVEILQGCGEGHGGSEVVLTIDGQKLPFTVEDTGHFQNFKPRTIGTVELKPGQQRMTVVPVKKAKAAIMDLRQVRLIPVQE